MQHPPPIVETRPRAAQRLLVLLVAVLGTLIATTAVASAATATRTASSSGIEVASVLKTRVGVADHSAPALVGSRAPGNPVFIGEIGCTYNRIVSGSCVATKTRVCPVPGNSFTPETHVLMADGTTKPISEVKVGDKVTATDPRSGRTESHEVVDLIEGEGQKQLVEVKVRTRNGIQMIVATDGHPFWVDDKGAWVRADNLTIGDDLRGSDGLAYDVVGLQRRTETVKVHNLSIEGIHTYYVLAGEQAFLVHNQTKTRQPGVGPKTGIIYVRTDPNTGLQYVGQAESPGRFATRQAEHNASAVKLGSLKPGQTYRFQVLEKGVSIGDLDMLEQSYVNAGGGKGNLANSKNPIETEAEYRSLGGTCPR
jgi:hypothetical protein